MGFSDLRARYSTSEPVVVGDVPPGAASVICRTAFGVEHAARLESGSAVFSHLPPGTHAIEAWATDGRADRRGAHERHPESRRRSGHGVRELLPP